MRCALRIGPIRSALAPATSLATIEMTRPTASTIAADASRSPHRSTANVVRNGIDPYWQIAPTAPTTVGNPATARQSIGPGCGPGARPSRMPTDSASATIAMPAPTQNAPPPSMPGADRAEHRGDGQRDRERDAVHPHRHASARRSRDLGDEL